MIGNQPLFWDELGDYRHEQYDQPSARERRIRRRSAARRQLNRLEEAFEGVPDNWIVPQAPPAPPLPPPAPPVNYQEPRRFPIGPPPPMSNPVYGPEWRVPKSQYNLIKKYVLNRHGKRPRSKTPYKRTYRRRYYGGGRSYRSGPGNRMGPIVIQGQGGYWTDKLKAGASAGYRALQRGLPQGTFERLGTAVGGGMFGGSGAMMGGWAGRGVASLTGMGEYTIRKNDILQLDEGQQIASFGDMNHGVIIAHREYIGDITQSQLFSLTSYPINPGLPNSFPWLSQIAPNFDQYQVLGMVYTFKSTASDFGTTASMAMGTIIMATDYDSADSNYGSKLEMENAQYSTSAKPSADCMHAIECDPAITFAPLKYVRSGPVPPNKDIRLYDQGNFQFATSGMPDDGGAVGELWCTYKIAFFKPQLNNNTDILTDHYTAVAASDTSLWGSNAIKSPNSSLGTNIVNNTLFFPGLLSNPPLTARINHCYLVTLSVVGVNTSITNTIAITGTEMEVKLIAKFVPGTGNVNTTWLIVATKVTGNSPKIDLTGTSASLPGSINTVKTIITEIDTDVYADIV